ncbi:thiamine-phosphate kinase [Anabaena sp. FACHB-1237]|uniref:thiamine-phosphate kinase n=1 Tax=Anabaena sp. FACHB-1237 TaxID=2692769 RepID=UPI0016810296|nr:thiamine-phosphate kinase [Anabaena sp. FACHB-1237]MBD2137671.1 thiamine-phosphate kinase [Anabaena sp. FACHB-1237]
MNNLSNLKIKDIGEQGLLQKLQSFCPAHIIGDDAAVLPTNREYSLVVTTDMLIDGVHFSDLTTSPEDAGWRATAANLSDLAAMGATPLGITVALGLPSEISVNWVERLYDGITQCLQKYHVSIVGGDVVRSPITTLSITAFGEVDPNYVIRRHTAKIGDAIVITGFHGLSRAGLELLLNPEIGKHLKAEDKAALITAHQRPQPRLDVISILPKTAFPISGMDSSDGLADAVLQICRASGVGANIQYEQIPIPEVFNHLLKPEQRVQYILYGGEDFELVLCLPQQDALTLVQQLDKNAAIIGYITENKQVILSDKSGKIPDQVLTLNQGFQHF